VLGVVDSSEGSGPVGGLDEIFALFDLSNGLVKPALIDACGMICVFAFLLDISNATGSFPGGVWVSPFKGRLQARNSEKRIQG